MSERVIKDLTEQNRLSSETYWELQSKYEKLESENAALKKQNEKYREVLEDFVLEQDHMKGCCDDYTCQCMDRRYYNKDACIKRAEEVLKDD
jgi:hypothetical protein